MTHYAKMTTYSQFPVKNFLIPHWKKMILIAYLTSNWPQIFIKCHKGVGVSSTGSFGAIARSTYWWYHQIHQKMPQKNKKKNNQKKKKKKKKREPWMFVQHHLLKVPVGGQLGIDGRCYENHGTFFSLKTTIFLKT